MLPVLMLQGQDRFLAVLVAGCMGGVAGAYYSLCNVGMYASGDHLEEEAGSHLVSAFLVTGIQLGL